MIKNNISIRVQGLNKSYGFLKVLNNIDLDFYKGEFVTFFGPNGAGKTTLIKILSTLIKPDSGEIKINEFNLKKEVQEIRKVVGLISHENFLYHNLTVKENMKFFGELYGISNLSEIITSNLKKLDIYSKKDELVRNLSNGMKQRVSIARAILHGPEILLFDEPFVGLDYEGISLLMDLLNESKEKAKTVVITTHDLNLGLKHCDTVIVLDNGSIKYKKPACNLDLNDFEQEYKSLIS
ncbi:MAG: heme ABC exporter ATP-binding protein CcmA [Thermodesulfobacteriota bacterium]